jgi:hypothetical protein
MSRASLYYHRFLFLNLVAVSGFLGCTNATTSQGTLSLGTIASSGLGNGSSSVTQAPSNLTAVSPTQSSVILGWSFTGSNQGFLIQRRTTNGGDPFVTVENVSSNTLQYTDYGLNSSWLYDYQVITESSNGNSSPSNIATVQVLGAGSPAPTPIPSQSPIPAPAPGPTPTGTIVNVNSSMSAASIQSTMSSAPAGSTVLFAAGNYNVSGLNVPCANNLTVSGPANVPATAFLTGSSANTAIFNLNNCNGITIQYLHFQNAPGIYVGQTDNSNITVKYNQFTGVEGFIALYLDGYLGSTVTNGIIHNIDSNITVAYNSFGDAGSCTTEFASSQDLGGYCGGFHTHTGELLNLSVHHNYFYHIEEPVHLIQDAGYKPGTTNGVCVSCSIQNNYILNYHRIGIEMQLAIPNTGTAFILSHNSVIDPLNPFYGTYAVSLACCEGSGLIQGDGKSANPALYTNDDVLISTQGPGVPPYAFEWWGDGTQASNDLVEGNFANGFVWGYGAGPRSISNTTICGPNFSKDGGYSVNEGYPSYDAAPTNTNVTTGTSCSATLSTAPTISSSGGVVTLADSGQNTSIFYTTDGSTPVPGSGTTKLYTAPFSGSGVKAVGMWGVAPQPLSYPAGYGYIPSNIVSQ